MSVGSIIGGGIRLIRTQPQIIAIWVVLYGFVAALVTLAIRPLMASITAMQQQTLANRAIGIKISPVFPTGAVGSLIALELILAIVIVVVFAAVVRAIARPTEDRFAYLRIGKDELRLVGLSVLVVILSVLAEIVGLLVVVILAVVSSYVIGKIGGTVIGVVLGVALFLAFIYAQVRLSLAGAFTVIEGRIVIKNAWRAAKGHFWTLFGAYLVMAVITGAVGIAMIAVNQPHLLAAYASFNLQTIQATAQEQVKEHGAGITFGDIAQLFASAIVGIPLIIVFFGSVATAAVEMGGVRDTIAAEFD